MIPRRFAFVCYGLAWTLLTPLVAGYLLWRARRQPAYRLHWDERWALVYRPAAAQAAPSPSVGPLWIHAVSVGETRAAQPLIEALMARNPGLTVLLTHMTPTGREVGEALYAKRWPQRVTQAYLPYDYGWAMDRFLQHWRPRLGLIMESELWPALCDRASRWQVPLVLVNARLSERSLRKGLRWQALVTPALRSLAAVLAQTDADAARLRRLGRDSVAVLGNLKFDTTAAPDAVATGGKWRAVFGGRAVVLAASTREGEEALLLRAWREHGSGTAVSSPGDGDATRHRAALQPRPLLLIVPRHPQRFDAVAAEITAAGFSLARRSRDFPGACAEADVVLGDSMGEMAAYYAMADVAVIGGSLLPFGAQNLIEACAQGVPVLVGPHSYNFEQAAHEAIAAGAALRVLDAPVAIGQALGLIGDPAARAAMANAGRAFSVAHRGATQRTLDALAPWLG